MHALADLIRKAKRVYIIGNGGSAANAMHMANDLFSAGVRAHALTADNAVVTMIANDYGYEHIFSRQIAVYGEPGDLLIALSGSGKSPNILNGIAEAERIGMTVYRIFGAPHFDMQTAEETQIWNGHEAARWLKQHQRQG